MFKKILVPTDGSDFSRTAVVRGVKFASEVGAKVVGFYAKPEYKETYLGEGVYMDLATKKSFGEAADKHADEVLKFVREECEKLGVECECTSSDSDMPAEEIVKMSESSGCDLIFMASHGRRGIGRFLLGSETNKVITLSKIPVFVSK